MPERGRQHADRGAAVEVRHFRKMMARFHLGAGPTAALPQEPGDEGGLDHNRQGGNAQVPLVLLPQALRARAKLAPGREPVGADAPALQL